MSPQRDHPDSRRLATFVAGADEPDEAALVRGHLLDGRCLRCLREANRALAVAQELTAKAARRGLRAPVGSEERRASLERVARQVERGAFLHEVEEALAAELLEELLLLAPNDRREAVRESWRFHLLGFAEHLAERARSEVFEDVARAVELGRLAVEAGDCLETAVYGRPEVLTAQSRAWAALGNALRASTDLVEADRVLAVAERLLESADGDPQERIDFLSLLASLRGQQGRYEEARSLLAEAVALSRGHADPRVEGKLLVKLARVLGESGEPAEAILALEEADSLLDKARDGELVLIARHARAGWLVDCDRASEAAELFEGLAPAWAAHFRSLGQAQRLTWLSGWIAWGQGDLARAEEDFLSVQAAFREHEADYDYALVSLDLAAFYLEQGRTAEVRRLAEEMIPIFRSREIHRHALAALVLIQRSIEAETATVALLRDVARYLQRARHNPYLAYPPAG